MRMPTLGYRLTQQGQPLLPRIKDGQIVGASPRSAGLGVHIRIAFLFLRLYLLSRNEMLCSPFLPELVTNSLEKSDTACHFLGGIVVRYLFS